MNKIIFIVITAFCIGALISCAAPVSKGASLTSYASMKNEANQANMSSSLCGESEINDPTSPVSWVLEKDYSYKNAVTAAESAKTLIASKYGYNDSANTQTQPMTLDQYIQWQSNLKG